MANKAFGLTAFVLTVGGVHVSASGQPAAEPVGLEEITVTARRRAENLQDTPIAISALTGDALTRRQIFGTEDLDQVAPNLQFASYGPLTGNNSAAQVFIRGIGQTDASSGVDPGVGLYIDDVYIGRAVGGAMDFRDVASVQVLRGPQGTLFGRNTIGGAVLVTTVLPGEERGGTLRVGVGNDNLRELFGAVDLPINDALAARVSLGVRQRDGYVTRVFDGVDLGDEDSYTAQASLRWAPSDRFDLVARFDSTEEDENGSPFVFAAINEQQAFVAAVSVGAGCPGATFPPPSVPPQLVDPRCANDATYQLGPYTNGGTAPVSSSLDNWGTSLTANWQLGDAVTLKSITAYRELDWRGERDADNTPFVILHTDYQTSGDQLSQELQALFEKERLSGVLGLYYFEEQFHDFLQVPFAAPPPVVAGGGPGSRDYQSAQIDNDNWALFTQWTFEATDALSISAGVRYTEESKGVQIVGLSIFPASAPTPSPLPTTAPPLNVLSTPFEKTFDSATGSASVQYRWNDAVMTYLSWSQGFKSGGFNQRFNAPPPGFIPIAFDEEKAETVELGFKTDFGEIFRLNGALFSTDYDDMQLIYRLGIVPLLFNAGKASIDGAELELTYAPGDLIVEAGVGYLDDSIDEVATVPGTTATVGPSNTLPFTPDLHWHLGIGYDFRLGGDAYLLTPRLDASMTGEQYFDATNTVETAQLDDVTVVNASVTLASRQGRWRATAGVTNLTDELYPVAGNSSLTTASGYAEIVYARARTYFLSASFDFD
jgi:iron complex outermembrane receptor protein